MTKKRSIYRKPEGDPIDNAVKQYVVMENAFHDSIKQQRILQEAIDALDDADFNIYLMRTQG